MKRIYSIVAVALVFGFVGITQAFSGDFEHKIEKKMGKVSAAEMDQIVTEGIERGDLDAGFNVSTFALENGVENGVERADLQEQFDEDMGDLHEMIEEGTIDQAKFDKRAAKLQENFDQTVNGQ
jgi:hypothetical protein